MAESIWRECLWPRGCINDADSIETQREALVDSLKEKEPIFVELVCDPEWGVALQVKSDETHESRAIHYDLNQDDVAALRKFVECAELALKSCERRHIEEESRDGLKKLPRPTIAILDYLDNGQSDWFSAGEIVKALEGKFKTSSDNPRKVIYATVKNLVSSGLVDKSDDGKYRLAQVESE
jgi:hypothetical protein